MLYISISMWKDHFDGLLGQRAAARGEQAEEREEEEERFVDADEVYVHDLDCEITEQEVRYANSKLKCGKVSGLDEISAEF